MICPPYIQSPKRRENTRWEAKKPKGLSNHDVETSKGYTKMANTAILSELKRKIWKSRVLRASLVCIVNHSRFHSGTWTSSPHSCICSSVLQNTHARSFFPKATFPKIIRNCIPTWNGPQSLCLFQYEQMTQSLPHDTRVYFTYYVPCTCAVGVVAWRVPRCCCGL